MYYASLYKRYVVARQTARRGNSLKTACSLACFTKNPLGEPSLCK